MNTTSNMEEKGNSVIFMENDIIEDSCCPKCSKELVPNAEFCSCGFYIKASKISSEYSFVFFLMGFLILGLFILVITGFIPIISEQLSSKLASSEMSSVTSPNIYIENKIRTTSYSVFVRKIYQQDFRNKNILIIEIKPEYWIKMSKESKQSILKDVNTMWVNYYKGTNPKVRFANE